IVPWATTFSGLWPKATGKDPYVIPPTWLKAKAKLNPATAFNFVSTADTHGGNSGSATINAKGEIVGILFDGNIEGLPNRFVYTDEQARSVHVASQSVAEALKFIYSAANLLKELGLD
ncbi:MAG TPA: S46 family peptidase, partial [Bryobacteraceae bacterium]|nr:S46 family peptidase [Bryobacteraceae bacterium]